MTAIEVPSPAPHSYRTQLVISWLVVGLPLGYGIFNAVKAALKLFGG
ncbi:MAG: hypothetical protein H5T78_20980 [Nocardia sp.]|nr:hypothetical protein [Nocardia sp.]